MEIPEDIQQTATRFAGEYLAHDISCERLYRDVAALLVAERERCAKVAEEVGKGASRNREIYIMTGVAGLSRVIASAIRMSSIDAALSTPLGRDEMSGTIMMPAHYSISKLEGMADLRRLFPDGEANSLNFVMFSTSGVHGSYLSIEEVAASLGTEDESGLTVLVIQPRIVAMRYGSIEIEPEDVPFLLKLRESSKRVFAAQ